MFPPQAKDIKPIYYTTDTLQVLSERSKGNVFCFQERKLTLSTLVEKVPLNMIRSWP